MNIALIQLFEAIIIADGGFCEVNFTPNNIFGSNQWPETRVGDTRQQLCNFSSSNNNHNTTRKCITREEWNVPDYSQCVDVAYQRFDSVSHCKHLYMCYT